MAAGVFMAGSEMKSLFALLAIPLLAQQGVNFFSVEKERALGQRLASEIRRQSKPVDDPAIDAYVKRIGAKLIAQLREVRFEYQFEVISDGERTEPISLPGGYILIPVRWFIAAQDEAEFAGMLAHSVAHVALRHGTRMATRAQLTKLAAIPLFFMGGLSGSHADSHGAQLAIPVGFLKFQQGYELEADRFGLELAAGAGYEAAGFQRYIERSQPADSRLSALPARELRLARLQELVSSLPFSTPSSSGEEFRRVQETVRHMIGQPEQPRVPTLKR